MYWCRRGHCKDYLMCIEFGGALVLTVHTV